MDAPAPRPRKRNATRTAMVVAFAALVGSVLLSASGPGIPRSSGTFFGGPAQSSPAADALDRGDTILFGAWLGEWPSPDNDIIQRHEQVTGTKLDMVDVYLDWFTPVANVTPALYTITEAGAVPIVTWEAHWVTTRDVLDGTKVLPLRDGRRVPVDDYLNEFARGLCRVSWETGDPILVRVFHEMNGSWFAWGISYQAEDGSRPNTDETYRQAWRKVHAAFVQACARGGDIRLVWAVNHFSVGPGATFHGPFPGDAYVDYVGIDGYNWGTVGPWGWAPFPALFDKVYCEVATLSTRPVFISEWGSVEQGGDKAEWIASALERVESGAYPRVVGMIWLNDLKKEVEVGAKPVDWRVNSSPGALLAYAEGVERLKANRSAGAAAEGHAICP